MLTPDVEVKSKWPDTDLVFPDSGWDRDKNKWARQADKFESILPYIHEFTTAIDGGAFCGVWTLELVKHFDNVIAFEPDKDNRECLKQNLKGHNNYLLVGAALGEEDRMVKFTKHLSPTSHHIKSSAESDYAYEVDMVTIDDFNLQAVGFIKLDLEGYDLKGLQGAKETIARCKPIICIEMKNAGRRRYGLDDKEIRALLEEWGYTKLFRVSPDEVYAYNR